ncbi:MAG: acyl-CoA dehydratase activase-related protein [Christensenellales bacterium]
MSAKECRMGLDVGSTTVKCIVLDENKNILFNYYRRHFSDIADAVIALLEGAHSQLGNVTLTACVTGSGGLSVSKWLDLPFVQEVIAASSAVRTFIPDTDVAIELGGEDAKITYFSGSTEQRMNGTCAGGTGAFIDQMAALLETDAAGLDALASKATQVYDIAARCGVFAKSDIQPLINEGAAREDIAASVLQAVVNQTISGLACGRPIRGKVAFLGGPLHFLPALKARFISTLKLRDEDVMDTPYAMMFVAAGAAIMASGEPVHLDALLARTQLSQALDSASEYLPPLFESETEYAAFVARHKKASVPVRPIETASGPCYLGIDAGSTTTKAVLLSSDGHIVYTHYGANKGRPLDIVRQIISDIYDRLPEGAYIAYAASTGYGEYLVKAAMKLDTSEVETVAHYTAARYFKPDVDFILDIGGQDMKCMRIRDGVIDEVLLNEACSSGCGSFLETFAASLECDIESFARQALFARHPVDLGSRCTVFMNSKVRQAQKEGSALGDISAGLSYSVIKNALYKVIKLKSPEDLGKSVVVQGGTFLNDAVLCALELLTGREVVRPTIAGLMGAYGAALIARERAPENSVSSILTRKELDAMEIRQTSARCGRCENNCRLTVSHFGDGRRFISGNRCERGGLNAEKHNGLPDMYDYTYKRLFSYKPLENAPRGEIGIPRVLNIYEDYPFWHTFFTELGYRVVLSPRSSRSVYMAGIESIPSESLCYPAKIAHGAVRLLIDSGVKTIFYPCVPYEPKEQKLAANNYNCPIVTSYPENIKNNMPEIKENGVNFLMPFLPMDKPRALAKRLAEEFPHIPAREVYRAARLAWQEKIAFQNDIRRQGEKILAKVRRGEMQAIILGGRPYHIDPEINHGISSIITSLGFAVLTEQSVAHLGEYQPLRVLDQWMFHTRIYSAAHLAGRTEGLELVQLNSFGCGLDAVVTDQTHEILKAYGKIYTLIKIDEISNTGAVRIRLRSLAAAAADRKKHRVLDDIKDAVLQKTNAVVQKAVQTKDAVVQKAVQKKDSAVQKAVAYKKVVFEKFMRKDYTILSPQMSPIHFEFLQAAFETSGYRFKILPSVDHAAVEEGLKYVNNDACYPSILVTGQLIEAIKSGRYDTSKLACIITQTGGGCRASNYISFIRKALKDAGYGHIPVISLSAAGLEKHPGFKITPIMIRRAMRGLVYGDLLNRLLLATRPYETNPGETEAVLNKWKEIALDNLRNLSLKRFKRSIQDIVDAFEAIPVTSERKPVIGVVGEILVKYHPTANNQIVKVLEDEGAEVRVPDLIDFLLYCAYNTNFKHEKLGRSIWAKIAGNFVISVIENYRKQMRRVLKNSRRFSPPSYITEKAKAASEFLSIGNQTGEGWFLTGEMAELIAEGADGIVCVQPFACLPNHIVGKGVIQPIRAKYPDANIVAIDYDPGASEVNQLNRIKLMLSLAHEKIVKAEQQKSLA